MEFESVQHAIHFAKGSQTEIVIVEGKVIDVTKFKHAHPGGEESINKYIFQDVSIIYNNVKSHFTKTAIRELMKFKIGHIKTDKDNKPIVKDVQEHDIAYDVDLKKGTFYQVFTKLNLETYLAFIHDPKHMIDPPEAILFETPALEFFTKTPWYAIPIIWIPVVLYLMYYAFRYNGVSLPQIALCYGIGVFLWTLVEYFLHRCVFHIDEKLPDNRYAFVLHYALHGIHHAFPMDPNRLVFPPLAAVPIFYMFIKTYSYVFEEFGMAFLSGSITGYIMYDMTHYFIHHVSPKFKYYNWLKKYHIFHHYKDPHRGYGVSQHIWDKVFDTVLIMDEGEK
jgi:4-hydroxysphinganine ceramide fatty acyl 2-hydroxylase